MTSKEITNTLCRCHWTPKQHVLVPNVSWGLLAWEADLVVMFPSGWAEEVEIKVSRSDFKREFVDKQWKHMHLRAGTGGRSFGGGACLRRYWMAMPIALAESVIADVPKYAGVIGVNSGCQVLRQAPTLPGSRKLTDTEQKKLLRLGHLRYWDLRLKENNADGDRAD